MSAKKKRESKAARNKSNRNKDGNNPPRRRGKAAWVISPAIFAIIIAVITIAQAVDGHWGIWWVRWLCVPSLIVGLAFTIGELMYRYFGKSGLASIICALVTAGLLAIATIWWYNRLDLVSGWQPPELPKMCPKVMISLGNKHQEIDAHFLRTNSWGLMAYTPWDPFRFSIQNNRLWMDVTMLTTWGTLKIHGKNVEGEIPPGWQMQSCQNAFEIVDSQLKPILQVYYRKPNQIVVFGTVFTTNSIWTISRYWVGMTPHFVPPTDKAEVALDRMFRYPPTLWPGQLIEAWEPPPTPTKLEAFSAMMSEVTGHQIIATTGYTVIDGITNPTPSLDEIRRHMKSNFIAVPVK